MYNYGFCWGVRKGGGEKEANEISGENVLVTGLVWVGNFERIFFILLLFYLFCFVFFFFFFFFWAKRTKTIETSWVFEPEKNSFIFFIYM